MQNNRSEAILYATSWGGVKGQHDTAVAEEQQQMRGVNARENFT
jgi:hypothetical protein